MWQNHPVSIYPDDVAALSRSPKFAGGLNDANAAGKAASFVCGSVISFSLLVDSETKSIDEVRYTTNGCAFMIAAAEHVAKSVYGRKLTDLGGSNELSRSIIAGLRLAENERTHCIDAVVESFRSALADHRRRTIEEFQGETALICTCFGVSEDTILDLIAKQNTDTVAAVSAACNAGSGCGSCQMLVQELIDSVTNHQAI